LKGGGEQEKGKVFTKKERALRLLRGKNVIPFQKKTLNPPGEKKRENPQFFPPKCTAPKKRGKKRVKGKTVFTPEEKKTIVGCR